MGILLALIFMEPYIWLKELGDLKMQQNCQEVATESTYFQKKNSSAFSQLLLLYGIHSLLVPLCLGFNFARNHFFAFLSPDPLETFY